MQEKPDCRYANHCGSANKIPFSGTFSWPWVCTTNRPRLGYIVLRKSRQTRFATMPHFADNQIRLRRSANPTQQKRASKRDPWSGKRDSNSRPRPWQGRALPTELFPQYVKNSLLSATSKKFRNSNLPSLFLGTPPLSPFTFSASERKTRFELATLSLEG